MQYHRDGLLSSLGFVPKQTKCRPFMLLDFAQLPTAGASCGQSIREIRVVIQPPQHIVSGVVRYSGNAAIMYHCK